MDYVSPESQAVVVEAERRIQALPPQAGVLFVSAEAVPTRSGPSTNFKVVLGMERRFDRGTGIALVRTVLAKEINRGLIFDIHVFRGVRGSGRDEGSSAARTPPS